MDDDTWRLVNRAARFDRDDLDIGSCPNITIGGAIVWVYVNHDGRLNVSIWLDDTEPPVLREDGSVAIGINLGCDRVYQEDVAIQGGDGGAG